MSNRAQHWWQADIASPSEPHRQQALARQAQLTKPPGALGLLEHSAVALAAMLGSDTPAIERVGIAVFAADHGICEEGISAFPQAVTVQMIDNFVGGGAAISVLAQQLGASLRVINAGANTNTAFAAPVIDRPIAQGSKNFAKGPAMSEAECLAALALGRDIADEISEEDADLLIGGEMGIGNTSSASALGCALLNAKPEDLCGPGTGLDSKGVGHKAAVISTALERLASLPQPMSALQLLSELGGFEIAALSGFYLRAAKLGKPVLVDGFISTAAALYAQALAPASREWMLFAHRSAEPGHQAMLSALNAEPLLDMQLRLGEASAAALAVPLLRQACALHNGMATFEEAAVAAKLR